MCSASTKPLCCPEWPGGNEDVHKVATQCGLRIKQALAGPIHHLMEPIVNSIPDWATFAGLLAVFLAGACLRRQVPRHPPKQLHRKPAAHEPMPSTLAMARFAQPITPPAAPQVSESQARRALLDKTLSDIAREADEVPTHPMARVDTLWSDTLPFTSTGTGGLVDFAATEPAPLDAAEHALFSR